MSIRDDLIELGARALCKAHNPNMDPDYIPKGRNAKFCQIDGKDVPNWKHHVKDATIVLDAIFDYQRRKVGSQESK